ncbi:MAG: type I restriction-modification system subunit M [Bacilli bacterium]|nr:type I restriction-modification system subunit M [Bacilli bacterium]
MNKEQERENLHKTIWKIANELRGSVDGWDFKQYVLGLLFYRFISENIENYINEIQRKAGKEGFEYRNLSDDMAINAKSQLLEEKGFFILPSELFCNVRKTAKNNDNLNVVLANIFDNIESSARGTASEEDVKGLFDDFDVKSNKLGNTVEERNDKLSKMLDSIGNLQLGDYQSNTIDVFGDAYEFLMTMYASSAGKSGGEFFTPQEVGELLAKIVIEDKKEVNKVYDPCCGSGGLLLKFAKILGKENVKQGFYGQELNITTYNLARINMFLHDINYNNFNIAREDTLIHPMHWDDEPFDAIVSNPPYSISWAGKTNPILINDARFAPAGVLAPPGNADFAFLMHMLSWLSPRGTAAVVVFPGILYRGGAEQKIRQYMVDNNFIDCIIQLPPNIFFQTPIATAIMVMKKNKTDNNILFIDASDDFVKNPDKMKNGNNSNKLSDENIKNIYKLVKNRESVEGKAYLATYDEIKENEYTISVNTYLKTIIQEEIINIVELNERIGEIVKKQEQTRKELDQIIKELEIDYYE